MVSVDQSTQHVDPLHRRPAAARLNHRQPGSRARRQQLKTAMRSYGVVVPYVLGQHPVQLAFVPDQRPIQTLGPDRAHPAFRIGVPARVEDLAALVLFLPKTYVGPADQYDRQEAQQIGYPQRQ